MAPGSRKARGGFWIARRTPPPSALIVESAVDVLSAFELPCMQDTDLFLSTAGLATRMSPWIDAFHLQDIACGYDADPPGDQVVDRLIGTNPNPGASDPPAKRIGTTSCNHENPMLA